MAHTKPTLTATKTPEESLKALTQISLADGDVTLAAADRVNWLTVTNSDGSLRHVVPTSELRRV